MHHPITTVLKSTVMKDCPYILKRFLLYAITNAAEISRICYYLLSLLTPDRLQLNHPSNIKTPK
jgi:hypothetical protein